MKTSFLIPCHNKHTIFIPNIISCLSASSVKPDEVLFSISSYEESSKLDGLQEQIASLGIKINFLLHKETKNAAQNRNILASHASGELLIFQDADDMFHPQRIECIQYCFKHFDICHLAHSYEFTKAKTFNEIHFKNINMNNIKYFLMNKIYDDVFFDKFISHIQNGHYGVPNKKKKLTEDFPIHNGSISINKEVFEEIKWKEDRNKFLIAEDQDFNYEVYYNFNKSMLLYENIYFYNIGNGMNGGF